MSSKNKKSKLSDSGSESSASDSENSTPPNTPPRKSKEKSNKGKDSKPKASSEDSPKKSNSLKVAGESEPTWELTGKKFIKIRDFKGKTYIDVREYYEKDGKVMPGKKGVSMNIEQWQNLCSSIDEVNKVLNK